MEHADFAALTAAFAHLETSSALTENSATLTVQDLAKFGLVMRTDSRRREYLCQQLRIGYANGKQLLKRLNMFGISLAQVAKVMEGCE